MLIITADDWGLNKTATNNILSCYKIQSITTTCAMLFMKDSERAADLALEHNVDMGLHLNFTACFNGAQAPSSISAYQQSIVRYLTKNNYMRVIYNPFLKNKFEYVYKAQYEEFHRLYDKHPTHVNGHHHTHLCTNMVIDRIIPPKLKVRRNFTFVKNEKSSINRLYRKAVDSWLKRRFVTTDYLFSIQPYSDPNRIKDIISLAKSYNVELMVHPEMHDEITYLSGEAFQHLISEAQLGTFSDLT